MTSARSPRSSAGGCRNPSGYRSSLEVHSPLREGTVDTGTSALWPNQHELQARIAKRSRVWGCPPPDTAVWSTHAHPPGFMPATLLCYSARPMRFAGGPAVLCSLAAVALALALQISNGMFDERALALATLAGAVSVVAALWLRHGASPSEAPLGAQAILGAGCAWGLASQLLGNPTLYADPRALAGFRWFALAGLVVLSTYLCEHLRAPLMHARFLFLLVCFAVMGVAIVRASPKPWVDVWIVQQGAAEALRHGANPYSVSYPNIYGSLSGKMYAPELLVGGRLAAFPYPPLTVLTDLSAYLLLGDVRYALLALMLVGGWTLARVGEGASGELAALFVLFQPRTFFVLEQSWTEPLMLACFALALLLCARWRSGRPGPVLVGAVLGLLAVSKQSSPYLVMPLAFAFPARERWRALFTALALAVMIMAPFAAWDPRGFTRGVVRMQLLQPFRDDSLSLQALLAHLRPGEYGALAFVGLALGAGVLAAGLRRATDLAQAAATAAAAWFAVLLFYKQAFCNFYWLGVGLLCASVAARSRAGESAGSAASALALDGGGHTHRTARRAAHAAHASSVT